MKDFIYKFPLLVSGTLVKRYKRFLADVELVNGDIVTAHCPNTGPMIGVSEPCSPVLLSCHADPKRKYPYTWELIQMRDTPRTWVGINTAIPNRVVKKMLEERLIPELGSYSRVQPEVVYGQDRKSRIDFVLWPEEGDRPIYVEVKNTTWADGELALFPDTVTTRGQKHLQELMTIVPQCRSVMLYFINRGDCHYFSPGDTADPMYGQLFREAIDRGVEILPCRFEVTPEGIRYLGLAPLAC
ncbi:MAG: DNA/RNA nuclease SfsA [Geitlerinemataceae cyanobacterium]